MTDASFLFSVSQECSRALALALEASEESMAADEGHGTPEHAAERSYAAAAALQRLETTIAGLCFRYRRGTHHYRAANKREKATGVEYRGDAA